MILSHTPPNCGNILWRNSIIVQNPPKTCLKISLEVEMMSNFAPHDFLQQKNRRNYFQMNALHTVLGVGSKTFLQTPKSIHEKFIRQCWHCMSLGGGVWCAWNTEIRMTRFRGESHKQTYRVSRIDLFKDGVYNWDITAARGAKKTATNSPVK